MLEASKFRDRRSYKIPRSHPQDPTQEKPLFLVSYYVVDLDRQPSSLQSKTTYDNAL